MKHSEAFWSGFTAFFANLAVVQLAKYFGNDLVYQTVGTVVASFVVAATVYGRIRVKESRQQRDEDDS